MLTQRILWVVWPAFMVAAAAEFIFFGVLDPQDFTFFGEPIEASRMTIYSVGFFFFWAVGSASGALTCFLRRSPWEVNRCPLPPVDRPEGCPKRDDAAACCPPGPQ
jgi:hypothetical protein